MRARVWMLVLLWPLSALAADRYSSSLRLEPAWLVSSLGTPQYRVVNGGTVPIYSDFVGRIERWGDGWQPFSRGEPPGDEVRIGRLAPGAEILSQERVGSLARQFPPGRYRYRLQFGFSAKSARRDVMSAEFEIR